jgi:arginine utilization regulatory protein
MALLLAYDFPGNVRELKHALEHAVIMATGDEVQARDLPRSLWPGAAPAPTAAARTTPAPAAPARTAPAAGAPRTLRQVREAWLQPLEARWLADLLAACGGNVRVAARRAGVNTVTMYRLLQRRGLGRRRAAHAILG